MKFRIENEFSTIITSHQIQAKLMLSRERTAEETLATFTHEHRDTHKLTDCHLHDENCVRV